MISKLNRVSGMLFLLFAGAAFSVCAGELLWRAPLQKGEWLFSGTAGGTYSSTTSNNPLYNEIKGDFAIETRYSFARDFDIGINLPIHLDYISTESDSYTNTSGGVGDLGLSLFWTPTTMKKVAPLFGIASTFPTGSDTNGSLPRYNLQYNGNFPFYSNDALMISPSFGLNISLFTLDVSYRLVGSFLTNSNWYSTIENHFLIGHSVSEKVDIQFGFELASAIPTNSSLDEIDGLSAVVKPGIEIAVNDNVTLQTEVILGLTNNTVRRNSATYATTPDIGLSFTLDIRKGRNDKDSVDNSINSVIHPTDTVEIIPKIVDSIPVIDSVSIVDSRKDAVVTAEPALIIDSDGDGIPDINDLCNGEMELFNGIDDEDGCEDFSASVHSRNGDSHLLSGVAFASGSTELNRSSEISLRPLLNVMKQDSSQNIELRGFSDHSGGYDINISISQKRADAVRDYLVKNGINSARVSAGGYGANNPMADNRSTTGRKMNRRIEYIITN